VNPEDDKIRKLLHARFDSIAEEPIPARMYLRSPAWIDPARAALFVAVGIAVGLAMPHLRPEPPKPVVSSVPIAQPLPALAARAHYVYTREKRHAVEVAANEQEHLISWLSRRLDVPLKVPVLAQEGYALMGGRLLPGTTAPVAQFMYEDQSQRRLTVYIVGKSHKEPVTAFRYIQEGLVNVFYWVDPTCAYAVSGEIDRAELSRIANVIYKQLEGE
jgi:anti-sigma factor RsiW